MFTATEQRYAVIYAYISTTDQAGREYSLPRPPTAKVSRSELVCVPGHILSSVDLQWTYGENLEQNLQ